jgi:hypothetical protein
MGNIIINVVTALLAVFTFAACIGAILAGYAIGWLGLVVTAFLSYVLYLDQTEIIDNDY